MHSRFIGQPFLERPKAADIRTTIRLFGNAAIAFVPDA
jgi:hypothetical protein